MLLTWSAAHLQKPKLDRHMTGLQHFTAMILHHGSQLANLCFTACKLPLAGAHCHQVDTLPPGTFVEIATLHKIK